mmetsp:Transcript_21649/g.49253  ORF Transcript_21649/g.49253 Transcript_21649/m.49253 type:complete len:153 (+) Transcript_21649:333-791(+)
MTRPTLVSSQIFFSRRVNKCYLALTQNSKTSDVALENAGEIAMPVGGRPAVSKYEVVRRYGSQRTLLRMETMTGRKHQVRIHCAQGLGRPIMLDPLYSNEPEVSSKNGTGNKGKDAGDRFFLHASSLNIPQFEVEAEATIPDWWEDTIRQLK